MCGRRARLISQFARAAQVRTVNIPRFRDAAYCLIIICLLAVPATFTSAPASPLPRAALIIDESDPSSGAPTTFSSTLRSTLANFEPRVAVYGETLDLSRFAGLKQDAILRTYVEEKYNNIRFGAIVAIGASAFDLVSRWKSELWPGIPVVFAAIDEMTAAELKFDSNTTGLIMRRTIKSMMTAARILVPDLQGVAVLGGTLEKVPYRRAYLHEIPMLASESKLSNLTGLPLTEQVMRAGRLPDKTAILYTSLFVDDEGTRYSASDAMAEIAMVANRPIVIDVEALLGLGATGGFVLKNAGYGKDVAALVLRILDGASIAANPVAVGEFTQPVFDWRQLQRWKISESRLPPDSEIRFREVTTWERYAIQITTVVTAILFQAALISWLLYERRRRRFAEIATHNTMSDLMHADRMTSAAELSASIAHEVNQPLTGIVSSANAGFRWLAAATPEISKAQEAFKRIAAAGHHASEVIASVRALFKKGGEERTYIDINQLIHNAVSLEQRIIDRHHISLRLELNQSLPEILGDRVQLLQVILNLMRNAIDAIGSNDRRFLQIGSQVDGSGDILVSVEDSGTGIKKEDVDRIFQPLFTTKSKGLGIGLSICRSIIERHDGRLWVVSTVGQGSTFFVKLPRYKAGDCWEKLENSLEGAQSVS